MRGARGIAVAATGVQARDAGLEVADDGGNAVDAAVAAALVAMCTEPGIVSLAGGGYVAVWPDGADPVVLDGNVEMPGRSAPPGRRGAAVREVVTDYGGGVTLHAGAGSVATPGAVPALALAAERYGRLPWARLVAPAEAAVRHGYPTSHAAARYLGHVAHSLFGDDPGARALVLRPDGSALVGGEPARNPDLADTLLALAEEGPDLLVTGEVGRRMVEQVAGLGGLLGADDLAGYEVAVRPAVRRRVGDWGLALNPPPAVGGPVLSVMLTELARRGAWDWADLVEVQRSVLGHRLDVHDLSADLDADGHALLAAVERDGLGALPTSPSTAHVSVVDDQGDACAITVSSGYGAGLVVPGTGILLNNCLGEQELNRRGLHAAPPGTRLASNMAPTLGRTSDGRVLAVGSPGADRITTALLQVLAHALLPRRAGVVPRAVGADGVDGPDDLQQAVDRPRLHLRRTPDHGWVVEHEPDDGIAAAAAAAGLAARVHPAHHMYFGGVGAALLLADGKRADGGLLAAGDSRREAAVGVTRGR